MRRGPTIADVARAAGVSKGTVSFALNDRPGVAPATKARILAAAEELGFRPSHRARALSASRAFALGLVVARPAELLGADPFFPAFIAGVETALAEAEHALLLRVVTGDWPDEAEAYRRLAQDGRVDGVFLSDLRTGEDPRLRPPGGPAAAGRHSAAARRALPVPRRHPGRVHRYPRGRRAPGRTRTPPDRARGRAAAVRARQQTAPRLAAGAHRPRPAARARGGRRLHGRRRRRGHPPAAALASSRRPPSSMPTT